MASYLSIDPQTLASQYTQIDRAGKDNLLSAKSKQFTAQLNAIKKLQTSMGSFLTQLKDFRKADSSLLANTASSSSESTLAVKASGKAVAGSYDIFVQQLAVIIYPRLAQKGQSHLLHKPPRPNHWQTHSQLNLPP